MTRLLSSVLLLKLAFCSAEPQYTLTVQQPPAVTVSRGESVTLNCSFQGREIIWFASYWDFYRNNTRVASWTRRVYGMQPLLTAQPQEKTFIQHGDHTSSLVIADLQISDAGTYICRVKIMIPPPTRNWTGSGTVLRILAPPRVRLALSSVEEFTLVTCTVSEFCPASINVTLRSTCGGYHELENNRSTISNPDGTYNITYRAILTTAGCGTGTEVICSVEHETGQWIKDLRILEREELRLSSTLLIKVIGLAAFVVIVCVIFLGYHVYSEKTKVEQPSEWDTAKK